MAKRSCRRNVWGNVNGYEGGRHAWEFGCGTSALEIAEEWCKGGTPQEAELRYYSRDEKEGAENG